MATQEVTRDLPARPIAPVDESVVVPQVVRDAAARSEALHAQVYAPEPQPEPEPQPDPPAPEPNPQPDPPAPEPAPPPPAPAPVAEEAPAPSRAELDNSEWARRYNAMKGRWEQSQRVIGDMQQTLSDMGDELTRTQALIRGDRPRSQDAPQPDEPTRYLTPEDEQTFGNDFIDLAKRAAQEAIAPKLSALERENQQLKRRIGQTGRMTVGQYLDQHVAGWREVNVNPRFVQWLHSRDIYSGLVRKKMLEAAFQAADAPRVAAFFTKFLDEETATGHADPAPQPPEPVPPAPPREPAVPLATLAAPGRARPASGEPPASSADKPIFTRKQIAAFYDDVRRGAYRGQEPLKAQREAEIFAAQREGRVR